MDYDDDEKKHRNLGIPLSTVCYPSALGRRQVGFEYPVDGSGVG